MNDLSLLNMLQISDSMFPIGAFTLSNGLETLVQHGQVTTPQQLEQYCMDYLHILPYNDLGGAALAYHSAENEGALWQLDGLLAASRAPSELRMGTKRLCQRLIKVQQCIQHTPHLSAYGKAISNGCALGNHGIAVGLFIRDLSLDLEEALTIYTYSLLSAMVTNAVKLVPLSQMAGQQVLHRLFPLLASCVALAQQVTPAEIGIGGVGFDLSAMEHETLYSRMYIS